MRKTLSVFISCFILFVHSSAQTKIIVAVAANMQYTMEAIRDEFNKTDKTEIELVSGASGNLAQANYAGCAFDISCLRHATRTGCKEQKLSDTAESICSGLVGFMEREEKYSTSGDLSLL
jgi:hypothetical protein